MTIKGNSLIITCNKGGCGKTIKVDGNSMQAAHDAVVAKGWQFWNWKEQYCPSHFHPAAGAAPKGKAKKAAPKAKKAVAKKADKPARRVAKLIGVDTPAESATASA